MVVMNGSLFQSVLFFFFFITLLHDRSHFKDSDINESGQEKMSCMCLYVDIDNHPPLHIITQYLLLQI